VIRRISKPVTSLPHTLFLSRLSPTFFLPVLPCLHHHVLFHFTGSLMIQI
jgi:hypothetical protein